MTETVQPTTFEAVIEDVCLKNSVPSGVRKDVLIMAIELISWEATCLMGPSSRVSGEPGPEYRHAAKVLNEMAIPYEQKKAVQKAIFPFRNTEEGMVINPILLLPCDNPKLEGKRVLGVEFLQQTIDYRNKIEKEIAERS